ncbi:MAG: hypothetical protein A2X02_03245 [Bacteroidetes bacterium GWF2_29_10]|nr:MAG: hypothetical protein A2X02_03245 [Bacteroidetes bacterium GWF2_29_10]
MKQKLILFFILSLFLSCNKEKISKSRIIMLESFEQIKLNDAFELYITEGSNYSIEIVGDEKVIEYVDLKVENNTLTIENKKKWKWISPKKNKINIYVSSLPLKKITAADGCNIRTLTPITSMEFGLVLTGKSNQANLELRGNIFYYFNNFPTGGKLTLSGETEILKIWNFALMSVDARNLISKYAIVENSSKGDCHLTVLNKLEYSIRGEGNIYLYGKSLEIIANDISSSGRLFQY